MDGSILSSSIFHKMEAGGYSRGMFLPTTSTRSSGMERSLPEILAMAAFSAVLLGAALPNEVFRLGLWPLGFIALAPLYEALRQAPDHRTAALAGAVFGALQHAISSYWLFFYKNFALWTIGGTTLAYAVVYTLPALYLSFVAKRARFCGPALFALVWAVFEYGKSTGFLGYPWGLIPYSLSSLPITLQVADITGVYGLSALLALSSAVTAVALDRLGARLRTGLFSPARTASLAAPAEYAPNLPRGPVLPWLVFLSVCWALVLGYGFYRMTEPRRPDKTFRAAVVQQNIDPWYEGDEAALESNVRLARKAFDADVASTTGAAGAERKPDLVIFSETSLRRSYNENHSYYSTHPKDDPLLPLLKETESWLLTGAPYVLDWAEFKVMNAAILVDPAGRLIDFYGKSHPVPFTEAIPLMEFAWFRAFMKNVVGLEGGWTTGTRLTVFALPLRQGGSVRFSVPICFEDAFADLCGDFVREGAEILVNITNDSWSKTVSAEVQHWAAARFRAIETRRTLVRSTNGGVSCIVGPTGENLFELPLFEAGAEVVDVPVYTGNGLTVYTRYRDWFVALSVLLSAISIIVLGTRIKGGSHEHLRIPRVDTLH